MLTLRFLHPVRFAQAILIIALAVAMATGAFADRGKEKPRESDSKKGGAVEHRVDTRKSGAVEHKVDTRSDKNQSSEWWRARPGVPQGDSDRKPGNADWWRAKPQGREQWKVDTSRDNRRPGTSYPQRPDSRYDRDDRDGKPRVIVIDRNKRPDPPTYRGGYYYYSPQAHSRPCRYGHWVFDNRGPDYCRRSVYFHFGLFPYVQLTRVYTSPYVRVGYSRVTIDRDYYLTRDRNATLADALSDIREAWIYGRVDLMERHVTPRQHIAVLLDGSYDYSIDSEDYIDMTADALGEVSTISFNWENVRQRTDGDYTAFGRHTYRDPSGYTRSIYVSYTVRRIGSTYFITEVGSSTSPLG